MVSWIQWRMVVCSTLLLEQVLSSFPAAKSPCVSVQKKTTTTFSYLKSDPASEEFLLDCPDNNHKMRISSWYKLDDFDPPERDLMILFRFRAGHPLLVIGLEKKDGKRYFRIFHHDSNKVIHYILIPQEFHWSYFFFEISRTKSELALRTSYNYSHQDSQQESVTLGIFLLLRSFPTFL